MTLRKSLARRSLLALGVAVAALAGAQAQAQDYDVIIRGGTVFDGSLAPRKKADVAIKGDKIVLVGAVPATATAARVVDATGRYVTPGFIDPHNHAAPLIQTQELSGAPAMLHQGITSILLNPDGGGPADLKPQLADIAKWGPGINVAPMIGHNGVRQAVMQLQNRKATPAELARMQQLVKNAMDLGAYGLSTGPFYVPGKYSDTAELIAIAKAAAPYKDSFQTSHVRDEASYDVGLLNAVKELIEVSRQAKIMGVVTHIKAIGPDVWGKSKDVAKIIDDARKEGLSIWADQYAYGASSTGLSAAIVPGWAQEGGSAEIAKRIANPETRALMRKEMISNIERRGGANSLMIRGFRSDPSLDGKRLDEIAKTKLQEPVDAALDILSKGGAGVISFNMNEDDVETYMKQPWTVTSSDGALVRFGQGAEHPRAYGAFPRKFRRYVIDKPVLTWEQAVHSSSGLTADIFHFPERGYLKPGFYADVLVINPETIRDVATYVKPHAYSEGMDYVLVNGKFAIDGGKATSGHFGRILLRQR